MKLSEILDEIRVAKVIPKYTAILFDDMDSLLTDEEKEFMLKNSGVFQGLDKTRLLMRFSIWSNPISDGIYTKLNTLQFDYLIFPEPPSDDY